MKCVKCKKEKGGEFYSKDKTCKDCRKFAVRENRRLRADYYREYDKKRFKEDPKVKARHKRYQATDAGKESIRKSKKRWQESNPIKRGASVMLGNAVRDGRLQKPAACESCESEPKRLHGHHDDYAFPLIVRWLCPGCHNKWHKENGEGLNA
jgi:hypothetical protein